MNKFFMFALGATAGSLITWKLIEKKYKDLADEEIEAVREYYKNKDEGTTEANIEYIEGGSIDIIKNEYVNKVSNLKYSDNDDNYTIQLEQEDVIEPYTINPQEFGERIGFETKSWTCYADNIITNEIGEIIAEPENIIGDALSHFGEYEDDSVYVRNENYECDYEILKHDKTFDEVNGGEIDD